MSNLNNEPESLQKKIEKMLSKIPPDWDLAEKHGRANLAYDPTKCTDAYDMNSDKFCHCCQRQIPTDNDFYPLDDNFNLGELGEGFPVLFQLMKYLNLLLLFLFVVFFIPTIYLISSAVNKYGDKTVNEENLTLFSFGAFLKYMEPSNLHVFSER